MGATDPSRADTVTKGESRSRPLLPRLRSIAPYAAFAAIYVLLDANANIRSPVEDPTLFDLLPSLDVTVVLAVFACLAMRKSRVPPALHWALVVFFSFTRLLRFADGIETQYFNRVFNFYIDSPLLPDLVRLLYRTTPHLKFVLVIASVVPLAVAIVFAIHWSLRAAERLLEWKDNRFFFAGIVCVSLCLSFGAWHGKPEDHYAGLFRTSIVPRIYDESDFLLHVYGYRAEKLAAIESTKRIVDETPSDLARLHGANVLIFVVESYGRTVLDRPDMDRKIEPVYREMDGALGAAGFSVASTLLDSPTYGGRSWLAQATIMTGVRTPDQWHYELLKVEKPKTIADLFRGAGYRTVLFQPATTQEAPWGDFYRFDHNYYAPAFGYAGPAFAWATMPDEYVLDFVHRSELVHPSRPLLAVCALISSHAPWNEQPDLVGDWDRLGDGSIFMKMAPIRFDVDWPTLAKGTEGYARSIEYDLRLLQKFLLDFIHDDTLVVVLGDHQPAPDLTLKSPAHGVPVHVFSREPAFVEPFRKRGYVSGMRPDPGAAPKGMETFLIDLLADFSLKRAAMVQDRPPPASGG